MRYVVGLVIVFVSAAASAQPDGYVSAGATIGLDGVLDWLYTGLTVDAGTKLGPIMWLHGAVGVVGRTGYGAINQSITLIRPKADAYEGRLGLEAHLCTSDGTWCAIMGGDLGDRTNRLSGLFVASHAGLDVGGSNLRFRPSVVVEIGSPFADEAPVPDIGIGLTAAVAYQW